MKRYIGIVKRYIGDGEEDQTFTQEQVNSFMAKEKEKTNAQTEQLKADLVTVTDQNEVYKESAKLSEEQAKTFSDQTEEMRQRGLSDTQKHSETLASAENKVKTLETKVQDTEDEWKGKYHKELIDNELASACGPTKIHGGVHNTSHITSVLGPKTVVEEGKVIVKDFLVPLEKEGEFERKDVTALEAVAIMSQSKSHENLFKKLGKKGSGLDNDGDQHNDNPDGPSNMKEMKEFMKG